MTKTLFELSDEMLQLYEAVDFLGEDDQGIAAVVDGYLNRLKSDLNIKMDGYAALIRELDARAELRKVEGNRVMHRAKIDANRATQLKDRLRLFFLTHNLKTIETPRHRLTLAPNGGKLPVILNVPVEQLPADYVLETISYKADLDSIREALEDGVDIPGAELGERGFNIRIL